MPTHAQLTLHSYEHKMVMCWADVPFTLMQEWACAHVLLMWQVSGVKPSSTKVRNAILLLVVLKVMYDFPFLVFQYTYIIKKIYSYIRFAILKFLLSDIWFLIDADSEGWSTAFVKKWLQTDFSSTSIAKMPSPPGYPEQ